MKNGCAEIDEDAGLGARGSKVTEDLSDVLIGDGADCLEFNDKFAFDKEVGEKVTQ